MICWPSHPLSGELLTELSVAGDANWLLVPSIGRLREQRGAEGREWAARKLHHRDPIFP